MGELARLPSGAVIATQGGGHIIIHLGKGGFPDMVLGQVQSIPNPESSCLDALGQPLHLIGHLGDDAQEGLDGQFLDIDILQHLGLLPFGGQAIDLPELLQQLARPPHIIAFEPREGLGHEVWRVLVFHGE